MTGILSKKMAAKYIAAGLIGAVTPAYAFSLYLNNWDQLEALKFNAIFTATRCGLAALGTIPGINKIPFLNESYKLLIPEGYGFLAGSSIATVLDVFRQSRRKSKL